MTQEIEHRIVLTATLRCEAATVEAAVAELRQVGLRELARRTWREGQRQPVSKHECDLAIEHDSPLDVRALIDEGLAIELGTSFGFSLEAIVVVEAA